MPPVSSPRLIAVIALPLALACGSQNPVAASPAATPVREAPAADVAPAPVENAVAAAPETAEIPTTREVPTGCPAGEAACTPPGAFAESVCRGKFPELPLLMFQRGTPWPRMYVKAEWVEPVNAYGGERSETWMHFGEELLILKEHLGSGSKAIKVSGPADVDVLRWDGTCATIRKEMLVSYVTAPMDSSYVVMKYLDPAVREALLKDELVQRAADRERKDCKGSSVKHPTETCKKALQRLTDAVVLAVKKGIPLPTPERLPEWEK
jgi:hypothetical protein